MPATVEAAGIVSAVNCISILAKKRRKSLGANAARLRAARRASAVQTQNGENRAQDAAALSMTESRVPIWYAVIIAFIVASPPILGVYGHSYGYSPDLHTASIIQVGAAAVLALFFLLQARYRAIPFWYGPVLFPAMLFYAWAVLSLLWAPNYYEGAVKLLDWGGALLLALLVSQTLREERHVRMVLQGIFLAGALLILLGIAQYFFDVEWVDQHAKPAATFNNKNMAAQYTLLIFPVCMALAMYSAMLPWKLVFASFGIVALLFIFISDTRGSIIAVSVETLLLVLLALYKYLRSGDKRRALYILLAAAALLGILVATLLSIETAKGNALAWIIFRFSRLYEALSTFTGETRFQIWVNTVAMIVDRPLLGYGVGNWMVEYPMYHMTWRPDWEMSYRVQHINTHQDYLELAAETGLIGLFFMLWMGVQVVRVLFNILNRMNTRDTWLVLGAGVSMIGMAVNALGSFPFEQPVPVMMFMVYGGVLDFYYRRVNERAPAFHVPGAKVGQPAAIASVVLCAGLLIVHYRWYNSEIHFRQATIASRQQNNYLTLLHGEQALRWSRGRKRMANFIAVGHMQRGDVRRAVQAWEEVLETYPYLMHTLYNISIAYGQLGEYNKALEKADKLVEVRPTPKSYRQKARILQAMGRLTEAEEYYRKAIDRENNPRWVWLSAKETSKVQNMLSYLESLRKRSDAVQGQQPDNTPPAGPPISGS